MNFIHKKLSSLNERALSIIVFSLLFSWILAFPFEGQILYTLTEYYSIEPHAMVFSAISGTFSGLFLGGFFIKSMKAAKKLILSSTVICIAISALFLFPPNEFWLPALVLGSFLTGCCVSVWGFYLRSGTPKNERIKTVADGLIYSNILMILLNMIAIHISHILALKASMIVLGISLLFSLKLPSYEISSSYAQQKNNVSISKPFILLCLFIVVITINSGLMYQVQSPAFSHLKWLTSWYWAIPYIVALFIMRNLPRKINRSYILYIAIAMIGFSFIFFLLLDISVLSYFIVNTLMLGACGVYDLFWWSILGEMIDFKDNAAKILGIGLSANVFGVLLGGLIGNIGNMITSSNLSNTNPTLLALGVVCITLVMLPPLHKKLTLLLKDHAYLTMLSEMPSKDQDEIMHSFISLGQLTDRESEIVGLLLQGKTYKMIAGDLHVSENTVRTHIKNIYSKYNVQSRAELMNILFNI